MSSARTPRGPRIPDEANFDDLDPALANELRTLPDDLRDRVGRLLVAADLAVTEGDDAKAREYTSEAKRLAGRVACVREAFAVASYLCGDYSEALAELRAVRRMRGGDDFVPMMADCERALGKPEKALELFRGIDLAGLDPVTRAELLIVMAGARADVGQVDAALVTLETPDLTGCPDAASRARLQYAYADLWERAGNREKAREWFAAAMKSYPEDVIGAAQRLG
jgi:tetratricopeptide (TPR) repeat protein